MLDQVVKVVNFVVARAKNTRLFTILCDEMGSAHSHLLMYTAVRWLSRGKVLNRIFELRHEVHLFLLDSSPDLANYFEDEMWLKRVAYLADIFSQLNKTNLELQGQHVNPFQLKSKIEAFKRKLSHLANDLDKNDFSYLPQLRDFIEDAELTVSKSLTAEIKSHCSELATELSKYFPEEYSSKQWIANPFHDDLGAYNLSFEERDELINLSCDSTLKTYFKTTSLEKFWCCQETEYPKLSVRAIKFLLPFTSTYSCEVGFSSMIYLKNKYRNRSAITYMRLRLKKFSPRIIMLLEQKQAHPSH